MPKTTSWGVQRSPKRRDVRYRTDAVRPIHTPETLRGGVPSCPYDTPPRLRQGEALHKGQDFPKTGTEPAFPAVRISHVYAAQLNGLLPVPPDPQRLRCPSQPHC